MRSSLCSISLRKQCVLHLPTLQTFIFDSYVLRGGRRLGVPYIEEPARVKSLVWIEYGPLVLFVARTR